MGQNPKFGRNFFWTAPLIPSSSEYDSDEVTEEEEGGKVGGGGGGGGGGVGVDEQVEVEMAVYGDDVNSSMESVSLLK